MAEKPIVIPEEDDRYEERGIKPGKPKAKKSKKYSDFAEFVESRKEQGMPAAIFTHKCPDPDAISSMMAMSWMLKRAYNLDSTMFYDGEVSHPQNGSMVNLLSPDLKKVADYKLELHCMHILVDTIPSYAGIGELDIRGRFDVIIDHHRDLPNNFDGILIHKKSGSCAAIVFDMMQELVPENRWFDDELDADAKLATAMIAGIMTDTHFMLADDCTELERHAFNELFEYRNSNYLNQIVFFKRRKFWVDRKAHAISEAEIDEEGYAVVGLGLIPEKERDLIADMAEEMVSWASVETAVAFGVVGGDRIEGSVRSLNASLSVSEFCKKLGGKHGSGGGKQGKGAYQLPLAGFSIDDEEDEQDAQEAWISIKKREAKRISRIVNK
jgi:nanoRNase/pAp phosphatase (c-di-AMP/oligoRNAs hydrolase)